MMRSILLITLLVGFVLLANTPVFADGTQSAPDEATAATTTKSATEITNDATPAESEGAATTPLNITLPTGFFTSLSDLINDILRLVIAIAALLTFVYLIWGAFDWITSGGDQGQLTQARGKLTSAVIGLVIVAASYAILLIVLNFLGYESLEAVLSELGAR